MPENGSVTTVDIKSPGDAKLLRVVDGDTIVVKTNNTEQHVRIIGIDAPEKQECFAAESTSKLQDLLKSKWVSLHTKPGENKDKYGRLLRYVHSGGLDVGIELLKTGHAKNFPWFEHPRKKDYSAAASRAEESGVGLWGGC